MGTRKKRQNAAAEIRLNDYATQWLRKGFDWVYPKEIKGGFHGKPGTVVQIKGTDGRFLGVGIYEGGQIALRRYREDDGPIDQSFFRSRLIKALERRPGNIAYPQILSEAL